MESNNTAKRDGNSGHPAWDKTLAGVVLALCLYGGFYFCLSVPGRSGQGSIDFASGVAWERYNPAYRIGGKAAVMLFQPLQKLDQYFFPDRWRGRVILVQPTVVPSIPAGTL